MSAPSLFLCPDLTNDQVALPTAEAHHAIHVLRLREGALIGLLDGRGTRAEAILEQVAKHTATARIRSRVTEGPERNSRIQIAVALTKSIDRFEWFLEKATEVGVDRITPLRTARSERKTLRMDRSEAVLVAAMKQSRRVWLPTLDPLTELNELLRGPLPAQRLFGWCEGEHEPMMGCYDRTRDAVIVIGPEGDITPDEATLLRTHHFAAVSLGRARLRTETAALAACTWMSLDQQR